MLICHEPAFIISTCQVMNGETVLKRHEAAMTACRVFQLLGVSQRNQDRPRFMEVQSL